MISFNLFYKSNSERKKINGSQKISSGLGTGNSGIKIWGIRDCCFKNNDISFDLYPSSYKINKIRLWTMYRMFVSGFYCYYDLYSWVKNLSSSSPQHRNQIVVDVVRISNFRKFYHRISSVETRPNLASVPKFQEFYIVQIDESTAIYV